MNSMNQPALDHDPRWAAVLARDASQDGRFYYSVRTTGVYCRPSCPSRRARPENVAFHASCADAERAGFRPCKRCRPDQAAAAATLAERIAAACRLIETAEELPGLAGLAAAAGLSPFHFHRQFKKLTGVTPKAYAQTHRQNRVQRHLLAGASVTAALYEAGFNSNAPFYQAAASHLGMTPSQYAGGAKGAVIRFAVGVCRLGHVLVARSEVGVCAILLGDDPEYLLRDLQDRFRHATLIGGDDRFEALVAQVVGLVEHPARPVELPLDIRGTAFQRRVWQALRAIPPGTTVSYGELAASLGDANAARAVAGACAANRLAVAIPCHRVVRNDGGLSGYRWGIERKRQLLAAER